MAYIYKIIEPKEEIEEKKWLQAVLFFIANAFQFKDDTYRRNTWRNSSGDYQPPYFVHQWYHTYWGRAERNAWGCDSLVDRENHVGEFVQVEMFYTKLIVQSQFPPIFFLHDVGLMNSALKMLCQMKSDMVYIEIWIIRMYDLH